MTPSGLELIWSTPITVETVPPPEVGKPYIRPRESGVFLGQSVDRDGQITFLATRSDFSSSATVLLPDFERNGFQQMVPIRVEEPKSGGPSTFVERLFGLNRDANLKTTSVASITIDDENKIWLGGASDQYMGMASDSHSRAYIARLDRDGSPIWQKSYKTGAVPFVVSLTPASDDNVIVAAEDSRFQLSWLAMVAATDGRIVWERHIGNGKGIVVAASANNTFLVASFVSLQTQHSYEEGVAVRKVTASGDVGPSTIVRPGINTQQGANYGRLSISPADDGAYIVSSWAVSFEQNPALLKSSEIAKVDTEGRLLWRSNIPKSFVARTDRGGTTFCYQPAIATLANGDALIACALNGEIYTHIFNRFTGSYTQNTFPLPACNDGKRQVALSLFIRPGGQVFMSGTRPIGNTGPGCSWLAHLTSSGI